MSVGYLSNSKALTSVTLPPWILARNAPQCEPVNFHSARSAIVAALAVFGTNKLGPITATADVAIIPFRKERRLTDTFSFLDFLSLLNIVILLFELVSIFAVI